MKLTKVVLAAIVLLLSTVILYAQNEKETFPVLTGKYLGQEPPGLEPELFAPGIISTNADKGWTAISVCPITLSIKWYFNDATS